MNRTATTVLVVACLAATGASQTPAKKAFDRLKTLAGTWEGKASGMDIKVVYKVTGAGSALVETQFPDTPHEMVTVYHMDGSRLMLTHYCAAMNQPTMRFAPGKDPSNFRFDFVSGSNMRATDTHIHNVKYNLVDKNHIISEWGFYVKGKSSGVQKFDLRRVK